MFSPTVRPIGRTAWPATLETYRTSEGGYGKTTGQSSASTYHTFLVGLTYELLGRSVPQGEELVRFILSRRREDGGFVEVAAMRKSGTNPTAAGVGVLQLVGQGLAEEVRQGVGDLLAGMPSEEGGLRANGRVPLADLLSTFTGLWTLHELDDLARVDTRAAARYAQELEVRSGGFRGGLWDQQTDVEYTFYGLGVLALLS